MASAASAMNLDNTATTHHYYCHRCTRTVRVVPDSRSLLNCPICNDGFLQEVLTANPDLNHAAALSHPTNPSTHNPNNARTVSTGFNIQEYVRNVRAQGPPRSSIQFVFGDDAEPSSTSSESGLQEIIDHLSQNDEGLSVPTPASRISVERLMVVIVDENLLRSEMTNCAICQEGFEKYMILKQMPCTHLFHFQCLLTWLEGRNTCPLCRYQLETDDQLDVDLATGNRESGGARDALSTTMGESIADRVRMRRRRMRDM